MRNSKKIIIPIIILLIVLLTAGGVFAYVYMATDILKSDQELFFKYFAQITSEEGFIDKRIDTYNEKKQQNPYENYGDITIETQYPEELVDETIQEKVNDLSIEFLGKTDIQGQKVERDIEVDYGNNVVFPIKYKQDGNKFGLQFDEISKKFIAIRNENLDEFVEKFTGESIEDTISIDMSKITEISESVQFTEDEINQLKQIYGTTLQQQLTAENFSRTKTEQGENYTLEITGEQIKNIIIKMLEATKQNTLIIDKLNEIMLVSDPEAEKIEVSDIDDIIESMNEEDISEIPNLKITLGQTNKIINQIIIESEESKMIITKESTEDSLNYQISCESITTEEQEDIESMQVNLYLNMQYSGLKDFNNVQESYQLGYAINTEEVSMKCDYKMNSNNQFKESVLIDELDSDNALFLNDHEADVIINFLSQVGTRLLEVNKKQMEELGLKEYENPIIYSNPVTTLLVSMSMSVYNSAEETVEDTIEQSDFME